MLSSDEQTWLLGGMFKTYFKAIRAIILSFGYVGIPNSV